VGEWGRKCVFCGLEKRGGEGTGGGLQNNASVGVVEKEDPKTMAEEAKRGEILKRPFAWDNTAKGSGGGWGGTFIFLWG